jgi:hypothetical protein
MAGSSPTMTGWRVDPNGPWYYTRLFGVPPRFNAEQHALVFPKDLLLLRCAVLTRN